jgi:hypothetical protein
MIMNAQEQVEYGNRKLAHYNAWLMDSKRPFGVPYAGFPEDVEAPKAKRVAKVTDKVAKKGSVPAKMKAKRSGVTKLDQAKALFQANGSMGRDFVVALFMEQLSMSKAGASTYWYSVSK